MGGKGHVFAPGSHLGRRGGQRTPGMGGGWVAAAVVSSLYVSHEVEAGY